MRIGILTLPLHTNYGGILQAYALQTVLERMGHQVQVIHTPFIRPKASVVTKMKRLLKLALGRYEGYIDFETKSNEWLPIVSRNIVPFIEKHIKWSKLYNGYTKISESDFDGICVGSDQIWRPKMLLCDISNAFLSFAKDWNIKRIAYSASFGTDEWEYNEEATKVCQMLVKKFDAVSVREFGGVKLCKQNLNICAMHTLDPTMLLRVNDYLALIKDEPKESEANFLFSYVLDVTKEKTMLVENFADSRGMNIRKIDIEMGNHKCDIEERILPSVEFWLKSFRDANYVITDSFHACVFSIIFRKPFAVIVNNARGAARFHSLLSMLGLEDRIIKSQEEMKQLKNIDYDSVYNKLEEKRLYSYNYLKENLC